MIREKRFWPKLLFQQQSILGIKELATHYSSVVVELFYYCDDVDEKTVVLRQTVTKQGLPTDWRLLT